MEALKFDLVNALNWENCTHETEHGTLPTSEFLDKLIEVVSDNCIEKSIYHEIPEPIRYEAALARFRRWYQWIITSS